VAVAVNAITHTPLSSKLLMAQPAAAFHEMFHVYNTMHACTRLYREFMPVLKRLKKEGSSVPRICSRIEDCCNLYDFCQGELRDSFLTLSTNHATIPPANFIICLIYSCMLSCVAGDQNGQFHPTQLSVCNVTWCTIVCNFPDILHMHNMWH
jgi:hypothetical protein